MLVSASCFLNIPLTETPSNARSVKTYYRNTWNIHLQDTWSIYEGRVESDCVEDIQDNIYRRKCHREEGRRLTKWRTLRRRLPITKVFVP